MPSVTDSKGNSHTIGNRNERNEVDGNMSTLQATCTCGWAGNKVADYNDDQIRRVNQDAKRHLNEVGNPLRHLTPLHPRVIKSYSTDYFLIPEGQEQHDREEYRKAVTTLDEPRMLHFEEGHTGWKLLDPVPW